METKAGDRRVQGSENSTILEIKETDVLGAGGDSKAKKIDTTDEKSPRNECVVDVIDNIRDIENLKAEKVCRICHFGIDPLFGGSELIALGCDCKGEIGSSHQDCAETWFRHKGDRLCEICGNTAKNISIHTINEDNSVFMLEYSEMRLVAATLDTSRESSRRCKKSLCKFLVACLMIAFLLPWLFRGINIL